MNFLIVAKFSQSISADSRCYFASIIPKYCSAIAFITDSAMIKIGLNLF
ncbi:MAG: hypothetical protein ACI9XP_002072, partial [Lentimonas sp.]